MFSDNRGPRSFASLLLVAFAFPAIAAADPVIVEFRSLGGTPLVATGDVPDAFGPADVEATRKRVEARAAAIATARAEFLASLSDDLASRVGASYRHFPLVRMRVGADGAAALAANPRVVAVHPDRMVFPLLQSSLAYIGANDTHLAGYTGEGTSVAVLDSGIRYWNGAFGSCAPRGAFERQEDGDCRVVAFEPFATLEFGSGETDPYEVADAEAHGTNVGGIVAGVAPGTDLISCSVFAVYDPNPDTGFRGGAAAHDGDVTAALDWVVEHRDEFNIVAANMSLGSEVDPGSRGYCQGMMAGAYPAAFANTRDAGVLPVVASGNDNVKTAVGPPACVVSAVSVGAGYDDPAYGYTCGTGPVVPGAVTCFSNSNALVDVIAPGYDIDAGGIFGYSGTSMAAPHMAGTVAVYQARYLTDPLWTLERIRADAVPVVEAWPDQPYIHRYIRLGDHDAVMAFDAGAVLASDFTGIFIPNGDPTGVEVTADVECETVSCASNTVGAVYLDLAIATDSTGQLAFELEAPDGTVASYTVGEDDELGRYNLHSILGSQHLAGVFDSLRGVPIEGTWRLRLYDDTPGVDAYLHKAVLLVDSARVELRARPGAPAIVRPGEPFPVTVQITNRGNLPVASGVLDARLVRPEDGVAVATAPIPFPTPSSPGDPAWQGTVFLTSPIEGRFRLGVGGSSLDPDLAPGVVSEAVDVFVTTRTFAAFGVAPAVPQSGSEAQLLDWSVGIVESWAWNFGDGTTSAERTPTHAWDGEGEYVVTLSVTGPDGTSTAIRHVLVITPADDADPDGCGCAVAGGPRGGPALMGLLIVGWVVLRRRRRRIVGLAALGLVTVLTGWVACDEGSAGPADGDHLYGPWVSLLDPENPSEGDIEVHVRVGNDRGIPCDLVVEYRIGDGPWQDVTLRDPSGALAVEAGPVSGTEHVLDWQAITDLPGDVEDVRLRVTARDADGESAPVVSAPFSVLNFFVTNPHAVLITEVSTADRNVPGAARDDYVEIRNNTDGDIAMEGWTLVATSAAGGREEFTLDAVTLPAGGRMVLVESGAEYDGGWPLGGELPWSVEAYGSVALLATNDRGVDFVRWGGSSEPPPRNTTWSDDTPLPVPQTLTVLTRPDETTDRDSASDFCVASPTPAAASASCLVEVDRGDLLVTELDSQNTDDQVEILNLSGSPVDLAGWLVLWDGGELGAGTIPIPGRVIAAGERIGLRDNGVAGRFTGGILDLGQNLNIDGLVPIAVGLKNPHGHVVDFLAAGGSNVRWLDWTEVEPTPMPAPGTTLARRPGDPDTDSAADFCLSEPNITAATTACLEPLGFDLVISEVSAGRTDYFEIYNPGSEDVDLSQVYVSYATQGNVVEDYLLRGTVAAGAIIVVTEADIEGLEGEIILSARIRLGTDTPASVTLRDIHGFGIDYVRWGEAAGTPLWPDTWIGIGADPYTSNSNSKSIQRYPYDAADTNTLDDWCWANPSPGIPNVACE